MSINGRMTDKIQKIRSGCDLGPQVIEPEPACGISIGVAKKVVRDWTNRNHMNTKLRKILNVGNLITDIKYYMRGNLKLRNIKWEFHCSQFFFNWGTPIQRGALLQLMYSGLSTLSCSGNI